MTGQKLPITILARLGHCITYDAINEIETAQAELVEHFQSMALNLPLQPVAQGSKVSIFHFIVFTTIERKLANDALAVFNI